MVFTKFSTTVLNLSSFMVLVFSNFFHHEVVAATLIVVASADVVSVATVSIVIVCDVVGVRGPMKKTKSLFVFTLKPDLLPVITGGTTPGG